jgi:hypothetical protein
VIVKAVQLSWLYDRAISLLKGVANSEGNSEGKREGGNKDQWSHLFGLLHAILLLLAGTVIVSLRL